MLAAPAKSAKRLSSLFSLGSSKDSAEDKQEKTSSQSRPATRSSSAKSSHHQNHSMPRHSMRHAVSHQQLYTESNLNASSRNVSAPLPREPLREEPLLPPPSLSKVNPDLPDPSPEGRKRRQSWNGALPRLSSVLNRPSSMAGSNSSTASSSTTNLDTTRKGRNWVPAKSRMSSVDSSPPKSTMRAWIAGIGNEIPYDLAPLLGGEKVTELWDDRGDTYVYLFPESTGRPPSFKVDSSIFSSSPSLTVLARGTDPEPPQPSRDLPDLPEFQLSLHGSPPQSPEPNSAYDDQYGSEGARSRDYEFEDYPQELHLYLPVPLDSDVSKNKPVLLDGDVDMLVLFRNVFAFLIGQALVATPRYPSVFSIFMEISGLLNRFEFSNLDHSTFGETATSSFACYCEELNLVDVRKDREKTLDAIILGERMRYLPLYHEGFVHGVGMLDDIKRNLSSKYSVISPVTHKRLERGYLDLENRLNTTRDKLDDFDFPSLFAGIANSNIANEAKTIRFKNWKAAYLALRKNIMSYYRARFGSWPPKADPKKNHFEKNGLNRLVLMELYKDLTNLYDMLVDRTLLTTRSADMTTFDLNAEGEGDSTSRALRQIMSEYDRATPPVQPPIPFDMPRMPDIQTLRRKVDPKKEAKLRSKRLSRGEVNEILVGSYNHASMKPTPFLENFINFERRVGHGKSSDELADNRCGQWLFMYAVIQSLPMLTVDAPEVRYVQGVEYFLCVPPRGGSPWCQNDTKVGRSWFGVAGGSGVVNLPSDVVANGVDAVYRRSHCWQVATKWADEHQLHSSVMLDKPEDQDYNAASPAPPPSQTQSQYTTPNMTFPPPLSSTGSSSDRQPTPLLTPGDVTPPMLSLPLPNPGFHRQGNRSSIHMGLEALPLPAGVVPVEPPARPVSHNPNMSFDHILSEMPSKKKK